MNLHDISTTFHLTAQGWTIYRKKNHLPFSRFYWFLWLLQAWKSHLFSQDCRNILWNTKQMWLCKYCIYHTIFFCLFFCCCTCIIISKTLGKLSYQLAVVVCEEVWPRSPGPSLAAFYHSSKAKKLSDKTKTYDIRGL